MNRRFASVILFSLVVAALTSCLVYYFVVTNVEAASHRTVDARKCLVAARTLELGTLIGDADVKWIATGQVPAASAINDPKQAIGRGVISTIYEGEPIAAGRLAPVGAGAGLAAIIPSGKRAVALKVDDVVGLAGFVVPGMRVDAIVSARDAASKTNDVLSRTILQNIEVLSAGQKIEKTADGKPEDAQVVNLLVTPDEAEVLSLAAGEAKVQLVLRNPLDTAQSVTHGASLAQIFGHEPVPAVITRPVLPRAVPAKVKPPVTPPPDQTVEVFSGTKQSEQTIPQ